MVRIKQILTLIFVVAIVTVVTACGCNAGNGTVSGSESISVSNSVRNTTAGADAGSANVKYFITCKTDTGSPVQGVTIQLCSDTSCQRSETGDGGIAFFDVAPGEYDIEIQDIPEGYTVEGDNGFKTSKDKNNYSFTFSSAGCTVAAEPAVKTVAGADNTDAFGGEKPAGEKTEDIISSDTKSRYMEKKYLEEVDMDGVKVVMINYWEPWCGFCIREMPALEALYQKYKDDGLLIVGMHKDAEGAEEVIKATGVTYPIVHLPYPSVYVPVGYPETIFVDSEGNVMLPDGTTKGEDEYGYCGAKSYEDWEKIILSKLGK